MLWYISFDVAPEDKTLVALKCVREKQRGGGNGAVNLLLCTVDFKLLLPLLSLCNTRH